jgi:hypothetical protein
MRLLSHKRVLYVMLNLFQHPPLARPASQPAPLSEAWPGSEAGDGGGWGELLQKTLFWVDNGSTL